MFYFLYWFLVLRLQRNTIYRTWSCAAPSHSKAESTPWCWKEKRQNILQFTANSDSSVLSSMNCHSLWVFCLLLTVSALLFAMMALITAACKYCSIIYIVYLCVYLCKKIQYTSCIWIQEMNNLLSKLTFNVLIFQMKGQGWVRGIS